MHAKPSKVNTPLSTDGPQLRHESRAQDSSITDRVRRLPPSSAARNRVDPDANSMNGVAQLPLDRDGKFTPAFKGVLKHALEPVTQSRPPAVESN